MLYTVGIHTLEVKTAKEKRVNLVKSDVSCSFQSIALLILSLTHTHTHTHTHIHTHTHTHTHSHTHSFSHSQPTPSHPLNRSPSSHTREGH